MGNDAVDASEREEKGSERENADEGEAEAARGERSGVNTQRRRGIAEEGGDSSCEGWSVPQEKDSGGAPRWCLHDDGEMGNGARTLTIVDVESGKLKILDVVIADVGDNTDDGEETDERSPSTPPFSTVRPMRSWFGHFSVGNRLGDEGDVGANRRCRDHQKSGHGSVEC